MAAARRMGRPPTDEVAHGERRLEIIRTALDLFSRRGYAAVSLGQIAEGVGVTKSALYNHFASKEALYAAVLSNLMLLIADRIHGSLAQPIEFRSILRINLRSALLNSPASADMDEWMRDVREHLSPEQQAEVQAAYEHYTSALVALMQRGIDQGFLRSDLPPRTLAHTLERLVNGFQGRNRQSVGLEANEALVDLVLSLFVQGATSRS